MKRVLVMFEEMPERVRLLLMDVEDDQAELLRSFHGCYANAVGVPPEVEDRIARFFFDDDGFKHDDSVVNEPLDGVTVDLVVSTGFLM